MQKQGNGRTGRFVLVLVLVQRGWSGIKASTANGWNRECVKPTQEQENSRTGLLVCCLE